MKSLDFKVSGGINIPVVIQGGGGSAVTYYDGVYEVTPSAHADLELQTERKMMRENVLVNKIPYAEVSNQSGGLTATIGE